MESEQVLEAIYKELKSQNELFLRRREFLENKSLQLLAFSGVILGILWYRYWSTSEGVILLPLWLLTLSALSNMLGIILTKIYIGFVPCQLDELESWKSGGTFDAKQLFKRLIEEYGADCSKNEKAGISRWFYMYAGIWFFIVGLVSTMPTVLGLCPPVRSITLLVAGSVATIAIVVYSFVRYRRWIKDFNSREKRFSRLTGSNEWKKL